LLNVSCLQDYKIKSTIETKKIMQTVVFLVVGDEWLVMGGQWSVVGIG